MKAVCKQKFKKLTRNPFWVKKGKFRTVCGIDTVSANYTWNLVTCEKCKDSKPKGKTKIQNVDNDVNKCGKYSGY